MKEPWVAKSSRQTKVNANSTDYNMISCQENPKIKTNATNKSKGEFVDLTSNQYNHLNPDFSSAFNRDKTHFFKKTGVFTYMYDAAARHGFITEPFNKTKSPEGQPVFK